MHILAVDDDPIILELLEQFMLSVGGHTLMTAESATDALELLAQDKDIKFDCFFLDIQMPGTDGIALCEMIRDIPGYAKSPILMLTAMSDKAYIDRAFAAGASDYVTKPFEVAELRGRLALVDGLVSERKLSTDKKLAANKKKDPVPQPDTVNLNDPVHIRDVEGVIQYLALENYLTQLSRNKLFGSTVFAFNIRRIDELFDTTTPFEFGCLITDTAEAISDSLSGHQFLISYAGNGTFVCVTEGSWRLDPERLVDTVNLALHNMGLHFSDGRPMAFRVAIGRAIRLVWRSGHSAMDALIEAHTSAEEESLKCEKRLADFWTMGQSA